MVVNETEAQMIAECRAAHGFVARNGGDTSGLWSAQNRLRLYRKEQKRANSAPPPPPPEPVREVIIGGATPTKLAKRLADKGKKRRV